MKRRIEGRRKERREELREERKEGGKIEKKKKKIRVLHRLSVFPCVSMWA